MESKCWKITRRKQSNVKKVDVEIYTDGACRGNPGPGGWAALLRTGKNELMVNGAEPDSTNNRRELRSAIEGLATLKGSSFVSITTDSQYVKQGVLSWVEKWKLNGWKTASRKDVKNKDLWQELDELNNMHEVSWYWVKGHSGHGENERVDQAANLAIDLMLDEISLCDK